MASSLLSDSQIKQAMRVHFPEPDFVVGINHDFSSAGQVLQVYHRPAGRVVTTALSEASYDGICEDLDLFRETMITMENTVYRDLAAQGFGGLPFEPGNLDHEMIKALCYLAGYKLVEHMPASADTRGDALIYLVPENNGQRPLTERTADLMPPKCLALPLDYWRQLLTKRLNNTLANKSAII